MRKGWEFRKIRDLVVQIKEPVKVVANQTYKLLGVRWYGNGPFIREAVTTETSKASRLFPVQVGDFIYNRLFAWKGSFGLVTSEFEGCFVSGEFPLFRVNTELLDPVYLNLIMCQPSKWSQIEVESTGSTSVSRNRWKEEMFLEQDLLLPPLSVQKQIVDLLSSLDIYIDALRQRADSARTARNAVLHELLSEGGDDWTEITLVEILERSIGGVWGSESGTDQEEVLVVRSTEFTKSGFLNFKTGVRRSIKASQLSSRELREGDILLEKSGGGPEQPVGRVVFVESDIPSKTVCSNFIQLLTPSIEVAVPRFIFLLMRMWHSQNKTLEYQAQTTGIRNLRTSDYLEQVVLLPPLAEQKRIVEIVSSMDEVIQSTEQAVVNTKTLRSGLLSDLLSGNHEIPASYDSLLGAA
jgi:type I restriction enzyme S subunit